MIAVNTYRALNYVSGASQSILHILPHLTFITIPWGILISISQMKKTRHRADKKVVRGRTASEWWNKNVHSSLPTPERPLLATTVNAP